MVMINMPCPPCFEHAALSLGGGSGVHKHGVCAADMCDDALSGWETATAEDGTTPMSFAQAHGNAEAIRQVIAAKQLKEVSAALQSSRWCASDVCAHSCQPVALCCAGGLRQAKHGFPQPTLPSLQALTCPHPFPPAAGAGFRRTAQGHGGRRVSWRPPQ